MDTKVRTNHREYRYKKGFMLVVAFLILCFLIALLLNDVLKKKWAYESSAAQQIVEGYYNEPENSLDVLILGASTMRNGVSELEMFEQYGFTSYSRATSVQLPIVSYHLLLETLDKHDIKAVVMDASTLTNTILEQTESTMAGKLHEAIDYMEWSRRKITLIDDVIQAGFDVSWMDFLIPLYAYHDRWEEIDKNDFVYREWQDSYYYKGQFPVIKNTVYRFDEAYMSGGDNNESFFIDESLAEYFIKIIELCKERDIELCLVKTPVYNWNYYKHDLIQSFSDQYGVDFIDFNLPELQGEIGFDSTLDFVDAGMHPNVTGAKKISGYLGRHLFNVCDFDNVKDESVLLEWNEDLNHYKSVLRGAELSHETNLGTFIEMLDNENYITMLATRNDTSLYYNDYLDECFGKLGIHADFGDYKCLSYLALLRGNEIIAEMVDEEPLDNDNILTYSTKIAGHDISITSNANQLMDNSASIVFDGVNQSPEGRGFNFVVYDTNLNQIIATKSFNTGLNGKNFKRPNPFTNLNSLAEVLEIIDNEDYITVLNVCRNGSKYMPLTFNDVLEDKGLIPLDKAYNRAYIAVIDGTDVVYNEYGDLKDELGYVGSIDGIDISVTSSPFSSPSTSYISIGETDIRRDGNYPGIGIIVYSKSGRIPLLNRRFSWYEYQNALTVNNSVSSLTYLLNTAKANGYDIFCSYANTRTGYEVDEGALKVLAAYGIDSVEKSGAFSVAHLSADGVPEIVHRNSTAKIKVDIDNNQDETDSIVLKARKGRRSFTINGISYYKNGSGLSVYMYDRERRAVLAELHFAVKEQEDTTGLSAALKSPLEYLDLLNNDDLITVISVSAEGSRYMPGVVNDKLEDMGLIPLDKEINRPYIAVLDGSKVIHNEYGEPSSELTYIGTIAGVDVTAVSNTTEYDPHLYISVDGRQDNRGASATGLSFHVYSKSKKKPISIHRFDWSKNYMGAPAFSEKSNLTEILSTAKSYGYTVLALHSGDFLYGESYEEFTNTMNSMGFSQFGQANNYAGVLLSNGDVIENSDDYAAGVTFEEGDVKASLASSYYSLSAIFGSAEYSKIDNGFYLLIYDPENRAVVYDQILTY